METMSASLTPRPWDSAFFGFQVAEIDDRTLDERALAEHLLAARNERCELVYWRTDPRCAVSPDLLERFGGQLVDRRIVYRQSLHEADLRGTDAACRIVSERAVGPAGDELIGLAITAGQFSRFKIDRRFPASLFAALYQTWIERSARHEIADAVLVAQDDNAIDGVLGMSTISMAADTATIGLIAVRAAARDRGLGRALLQASHRWMLDRGVSEACVATQQDNERACTLYERCGYRVGERSLVYHFWPNHDAGPIG